MKYLLLTFLVFIAGQLIAQKQTYDIELFNKTIGKGDVAKTSNGSGVEEYTIKTDATATVFFKDHTSSSDIKIVMKDKKMVSCTMVREKDGEYQNISILWNGVQYDVDIDGKKTSTSKSITFTTTHLFFEEPKNKTEVYVERLNEWVPIEHLGNGEYKTEVDGGTNFYTYKDGKLVEMRIKKGVNIYMKRTS